MNPTSSHKGFALLELLITLGVFVLIGFAVTLLFKDNFSFNRTVSQSLEYIGEVRRATKIMTAELRAASPSSLGSYPIADAGTSTVTFYVNVDNDGHKERVRYYLQNAVLYRGVIDPAGSPLNYAQTETTSILVHNVTNTSTSPLFTYYDRTYAGTTTPLSFPVSVNMIRLIDIQFLVDVDMNSTTPNQIHTTQVTFRNLKDNL